VRSCLITNYELNSASPLSGPVVSSSLPGIWSWTWVAGLTRRQCFVGLCGGPLPSPEQVGFMTASLSCCATSASHFD